MGFPAQLVDWLGKLISPKNPLPVAAALPDPPNPTMLNVAGAVLELSLGPGIGSIAIQLSGTFTATVQFEALQQDEGSWFAVYPTPIGGGLPASSATATGQWSVGNPGWKKFRLRVSAYTSGGIMATLGISSGSSGPASVGSSGGSAVDLTAVGGTAVVTGGVAGLLAVGTVPYNLQLAPISLFNMTTRQAGVTQKGLIFPTTIANTFPAAASGTATNITNASNVCGGVFSPDPRWDSVLLDFAAQGVNAADTLTVEIGRIKKSSGIAEILASVVLTWSSTTLAVSVDPFTAAAHAAATWRFADVTAITANSQLGDVLQALGGTSGNLAQLSLNCHDVLYYYIVITAFADGGVRTSEVTCVMTPKS